MKNFDKRFNLQFSKLKRNISESILKDLFESDINPKTQHKFDIEMKNGLQIIKMNHRKRFIQTKICNSIYESDNYRQKNNNLYYIIICTVFLQF